MFTIRLKKSSEWSEDFSGKFRECIEHCRKIAGDEILVIWNKNVRIAECTRHGAIWIRGEEKL